MKMIKINFQKVFLSKFVMKNAHAAEEYVQYNKFMIVAICVFMAIKWELLVGLNMKMGKLQLLDANFYNYLLQ